MVDVGVGEEDALDGRACSGGGGEDVVFRAGQAGVDEGKAVWLRGTGVLTDEVAVDQPVPGKLKDIFRDLRGCHTGDLACVLARGGMQVTQAGLDDGMKGVDTGDEDDAERYDEPVPIAFEPGLRVLGSAHVWDPPCCFLRYYVKRSGSAKRW